MARRMEIELTSKRDDGTWTWRAAGAREPKGTLDGALVPPAVQVGEVVKVEVEGFLDGISIVSVVPPKAARSEPERLDLLTPRSEGPLVTTRLARTPRREGPRSADRRDRGDRGARSDRGDRGDRGDARRGRGDRDRNERGPRSDRGDRADRGGERGGERGDRGDRRERTPSTPPVDAKPKPKRLRPAKVHRTALLEALPAEQRPIAEQLLQGGIPAVRQAIEKQNEELKAEGKSQVAADPLIEIAERLRNRAQAAAWRDRADAALAQVDDLDLRDLRSVVNAAADGGRDEEARNVADQLRDQLIARVEKEHNAWVEEVAENLRESRVVRALRLSSRPPKAGSPLPPDLSNQLIEATSAALTSETGPQRWATILDALAFSPIRRRVVPISLPDKLNAELRQTIARLGSRLPEISHIFDIKPEEGPPRPPRGGAAGQARRGGKGPGGRGDQADGKSKPRNKKRDRPDKGDDAKGKDDEAEASTEKPSDAKAPEGTEVEAAATATDAEANTVTDEATAANAAGTEETVDATDEATPEAVADEPAPVDDKPSAETPADEPAAEVPVAEAAGDEPEPEPAVAVEAAPADQPEAAPADEAPAARVDAEVEPEASNGHAAEGNGQDDVETESDDETVGADS
jgi:hypothetical protein